MAVMISETIEFLGVVAVVYTVHRQLAAAKSLDAERGASDRWDRRRERLLSLYAAWSGQLLEVLSRKHLVVTKPPIRNDEDLRPALQDLHANTDAAIRATAELNPSDSRK